MIGRHISAISGAAFTAALAVGAAQAASLPVTFDQTGTVGDASGTTLTLDFGNAGAGATSFGNADFVSRTWAGLDVLGAPNVRAALGLFPPSHVAGSTVTISSAISGSAAGASLNFGFG